MKFSKNLQRLIQEEPPEWQDKFLSYKDLKKSLKLIFPKEDADLASANGGCGQKRRRIECFEAASELTFSEHNGEDSDSESSYLLNESNGSNIYLGDAVVDDVPRYPFSESRCCFIRMLQPQLDKLNDFFVEKEAEYIIRQKELLDGVQRVRSGRLSSAATYSREMIKFLKDIVDFHAEGVLLVFYSIVNFTGLVKILKKYDKRTGAELRVQYMPKVLKEPFFVVETVFEIVKQCERLLQELLSEERQILEEAPAESSDAEALDLGRDELSRSIEAARRTMLEMRRGSSTYSPFSLPPLHDFP